MTLTTLKQRIADRTAVVGLIGLGYVGLPVACTIAQAGFVVVGVDHDADRVTVVQAGHSPIEGDEPGLAELLATVIASGRLQATTDYAELHVADLILIAVETPVDSHHLPNYAALQAACAELGPVLKPGALVIIESTVAPGTVTKVVQPRLEASVGPVNEAFYLGACPERVMPGKLLANLRQMSRVCGGSTPAVADVMVTLYRHFVQADLDPTDITTAELVKTTENAYRDVQIAFANEVALICEAQGADVWRVRELVNKSPYRQMHLPGAGVGGHCIPKDPWLLAAGAAPNTHLRVIPAARAINDAMPAHVADLVLAALATAGRQPTASRIAVLGYAYLENSDDIRNSPSAALVATLQRHSLSVAIHDPWIKAYQAPLLDVISGADAVVVMVGHTAYRPLDFAALRAHLRTPILIDGRGLYEPATVEAAGLHYWGVGRPQPQRTPV